METLVKVTTRLSEEACESSSVTHVSLPAKRWMLAGHGSDLSMGARREVTARFAKAYARASKKDKGRIFNDVVEAAGWSRNNARCRLTAAAKRPSGRGRAEPKARKPRGRNYFDDWV